MEGLELNWKELSPFERFELLKENAPQILPLEEFLHYKKFANPIALYEMAGETFVVRIAPSWEIIYFTGQPVFELWLLKGSDENLNEFFRNGRVFSLLTEFRLRFIVAQEGKDIYNPLESFRVFADVLRKIKDTGYYIFMEDADKFLGERSEKWFELTARVVNELRKKSYGAIHPRQALADFGYKKMKIGKIFYSAYNPLRVPGKGDKVDVKAAEDFLWTYVWNQMVPVIGQEKAEEIFSDFTNYYQGVVNFYLEKRKSKF